MKDPLPDGKWAWERIAGSVGQASTSKGSWFKGRSAGRGIKARGMLRERCMVGDDVFIDWYGNSPQKIKGEGKILVSADQ